MVLTFKYLYESKIRTVHTLEIWTGGTIRLRLFLLPIFPSSPILIMRVVWFDNLQTIVTDKDPVLIFLDTNSKKSVLMERTLMTWLHYSNLNPNSASEFYLSEMGFGIPLESLPPTIPSPSYPSLDKAPVQKNLI